LWLLVESDRTAPALLICEGEEGCIYVLRSQVMCYRVVRLYRADIYIYAAGEPCKAYHRVMLKETPKRAK
jgi:hypothetical protein